jgi:hypothetical protein
MNFDLDGALSSHPINPDGRLAQARMAPAPSALEGRPRRVQMGREDGGDPEPSFFPGSLRKEGKPKVPCQEVGEGKPRSRPGGPSRGCMCEEAASVEPGGKVFSCVRTVQRCSRPAGECAPRLARFRQLTWPRHSVSVPRGPGAEPSRISSGESRGPLVRW